jgi:glycosyltransferase involved in cell wall biosynthesis
VPFDRRVWQEALALKAAGYGVTVVCPRGAKRDSVPHEVVDGVEIHRFPLTEASGGFAGYAREYGSAFWHVWRTVGRLSRSRRFDVVHACNPPDFLLLAALGRKLRGARFLFDQHDLVPETYLSRFQRGRDPLYWLTRLFERITYTLADVVVATNESYRGVALTRGHKRAEDVFVVRSAPDLSRFVPAAPDPELRRGRAHLLAYLGVMGPQDGLDHAVRALAHLRKRRSDWRAVFIGDGDVLPAMRELAAELGLADDVEFTGRLPDEDVITVLSTADVCLAPDPKNPLNDVSTMNKILEYMALRRPVVSYDLVEARVSAGEAAVYARPNDEAAFAEAISDLLDDPQRRESMGAAGRARLEQSLSWASSERALLAAYARALDGSSAPLAASSIEEGA